jgi:hypothetical protein
LSETSQRGIGRPATPALKDVPFEPHDFILAPDFVEFLAVFITMGITFAVLTALGNWWAK